MDVDDRDSSREEEFLSLKERILLLRNQADDKANEKHNSNFTSKNLSSSSKSNIHSISDSEESDSCTKDSDEFELPSLEFAPSAQNVQEVILLSDGEDELKAISNNLKIPKSSSEYKIETTYKKYYEEEDNSAEEAFIEIEVSKKLKKSPKEKNIEKIYHPLYEEEEDNSTDEVSDKIKISKKLKQSPNKKVKDLSKDLARIEKQKHREEKKREQELAKALRQSEKEVQKSKKPDECLKAMKVVIDHNLIIEKDSQDIFCALDEKNVKYCIEENPISLSIAWCKTVVDVTIENNQVIKEEKEEFENNLVILIPNHSFVKMVHAYMQKSKGKDTCDTILTDYVVNISSMFPDIKISFVILCLDQYLRSLKESNDGDLKRMGKQVSKIIIEEALVEVQLQAAVNFIFVNSMREVGDLIFRFTKAIAEAPQKREKQLQKDLAFSWYADADTSCPVKLGKDRQSFAKLWQQQLQQFQNVGLETAEAIAAMYESPTCLMKAYQQCSSTKEAERLLQDIVVRRNYGPLGTQRRIGPELSYKIYLFFSCQDGNQILQR